jgi:SAM-dependent methyltransferase
MAAETATANRIALDLLEVRPTDQILEIGFGHGATIARLAERAGQGCVAGVDASAAMLHMAARRNRDDVARGLVELRQARAEDLPYASGRFDKALSVHTLYFWPEPLCALVEIRRVLRQAGRLVLGWRGDPAANKQFPESTYRFHSDDTVQALLAAAGFRRVRILRESVGRATLCFAIAEDSEK